MNIMSEIINILNLIKNFVMSIILFPVILAMMISANNSQNSLESFFEKWEAEKDSNIAIIDESNETIVFQAPSLGISEALVNRFESLHYLNPLVVHNEMIFFTKMDQDDIVLYSINLNTNEIEAHYSCDSELFSVDVIYSEFKIYFIHESYTTVFELDDYTIFDLPQDLNPAIEQLYTVETIIDETGSSNKGFIILGNGITRTINFDYMSLKSEYISSLITLEKKSSIFGTKDPLSDFFSHAYIVNDKVYLYCLVRDADGECNALIFSYDPLTEEVKYLYRGFSHEFTHISIVPVE